MSFSVLALGDLVADLVFTIPQLPVMAEQHQKAHSVSIEPGGAGNFLIAGARLGMGMHALGAIGDDALGDQHAHDPGRGRRGRWTPSSCSQGP